MEARTKKRFTQWDLALLTGLSQSKISLIERGYIMPTDSEERIILTSLGVTKEEIQWHDRRTYPDGIAISEV
jgi:predicted transcriptional regulator